MGHFERVTGVEPASSGWKPEVLPHIPHTHFHLLYHFHQMVRVAHHEIESRPERYQHSVLPLY